MKKIVVILLALLSLGVMMTAAQDARTPDDICAAAVPADTPSNRTYSAPDEVLEEGVDYRAIFCTETGAIYVDLLEDYAPITVNSFVFLADNGYFNNITFHRVIENFMAQGGDPTATGTGGPGYSFQNEQVGFLHFDSPGWLAMANAGRDTNGSQFFITTAMYPPLDYQYTIFGKVLEGQENVEALKLRDPQTEPDFEGSRLDTVVIITDPASVATDYVEAESASQDDVVAAFTDLVPRLTERYTLPEDLGLAEQTSGLLTTDDVVAAAPEDQQEALGDFLSKYNHEYRVTGTLNNTTCEAGLPFTTTTYTLDAFASSADATAALADGFLDQQPLENGFAEKVDSDWLANPYFTADTTACEGDAVRALTYWQRGRFIATVEATIQAENAQYADLILSDVVGLQLFEYLATDVLRAELP
jgi:cyclophilin family peptidyl-prolyl cis-trans isomerase